MREARPQERQEHLEMTMAYEPSSSRWWAPSGGRVPLPRRPSQNRRVVVAVFDRDHELAWTRRENWMACPWAWTQWMERELPERACHKLLPWRLHLWRAEADDEERIKEASEGE